MKPTSATDQSGIWMQDELELVLCDLCGANIKSAEFIRPDGLSMAVCLACDLGFINPRPRLDAINKLYQIDYYSDTSKHINLGYSNYLSRSMRDNFINHAHGRLSLLTEHTDVKGRNLLEIGCATGEYCKVAHQAGMQTIGIDLSEDVIRVARQRYRQLDFRVGSLESLAFADCSFDIVVAHEVIEHVPSPQAWLKEIQRVLKPGGLVALSTPNLACGRHLGWNSWLGLRTSFEHLYFFSEASINRALSLADLQPLTCLTRGSGDFVPDTSPGAKDILKGLLERTHLLRPARFLRNSTFGRPKPTWQTGGVGHCLYSIAQKRL
jgi:2-polyprenyl-3-methyl-5-hydroxy-6-metoxy-1,4-benzoquinol methylase